MQTGRWGIPPHITASTNERHTKPRWLTGAKLQPRPQRRYPLNISLENEFDECRLFIGKCRRRLFSERGTAFDCVSPSVRLRLVPRAVVSPPAFAKKHRH